MARDNVGKFWHIIAEFVHNSEQHKGDNENNYKVKCPFDSIQPLAALAEDAR